MPAPYPPRKYWPGYMINAKSTMYQAPCDSIKLSQVKRPESKVWIAEGSYHSKLGYESWAPTASPFGNPGGIDNGSTDPQPVSKRHRGGSNIVFFDGHAAWMRYEEVTPDFYAFELPSVTYWDVDEDGNWTTP